MITVMVVKMIMMAGGGDLGPVLARPGAGGQERGPGEVCEGEIERSVRRAMIGLSDAR